MGSGCLTVCPRIDLISEEPTVRRKERFIMRNHLPLLAAACLAVGGAGLVGCDRDDDDASVNVRTPSGDARVKVDTDDDDVKDAAETAGNKVERGMEKTGDAV